jgi:hypothetical protein
MRAERVPSAMSRSVTLAKEETSGKASPCSLMSPRVSKKSIASSLGWERPA